MLDVEDRIRGAINGLVVGDALGAPVEFMNAEVIAERYGKITDMMDGGPWLAGEWTDDTALTLAAAEGYRGVAFDLEGAAEAMVTWMKSGPKDIGNLTAGALGLIATGRAGAHDAGMVALETRPGNAGNGSLMRALPTGLVRSFDDPRLVAESIAISRITHADPRCVFSCIAFNLIIAALVSGEVTPRDAVALTARHASIKDAQVRGIMQDALAGDPVRFRNADGIGYVLVCFERGVRALLSVTTFEEGVVEVVNMGGDTDTNGAVAGALLGARSGLAAIPARWREALREQGPIRAAVEVLLAAREA